MEPDEESLKKFLQDVQCKLRTGAFNLPLQTRRSCLETFDNPALFGSAPMAVGGKLIFLSALGGCAELVSNLLAAGISKDYNWSGAPPLFAAAMEGHLEVIRVLVDHGADLETASTTSPHFNAVFNHQTPLLAAIEGGH